MSRSKSALHLDQRSRSGRGREDLRPGTSLQGASVAAPRGKEKARDLTPKSSVAPNRRESAPSSLYVEQRGARSPKLSFEAGSFNFGRVERHNRPFRRHELQGIAQHLKDEGPVLKPLRTTLTAAHRSTSNPLPFSYADALLVPKGSQTVAQTSRVNLSPEWAVRRPSANPQQAILRHSGSSPLVNVDSFDSSIDDKSDAASTIFDAPEDDHDDRDESFSDLNTDISSSSLDLPSELNRDDRLMNPKQYFQDLEDLESTVAGNSGLFLMRQKNRQAYPVGDQYVLNFEYESCCREGRVVERRSYDETVISFCNESSRSSTSGTPPSYQRKTPQDLAFWAFHILECRNLMLAIVSNLERMIRKRYSASSINALGIDPHRPNVARLVQISNDSIFKLHEAFESAIELVVASIESQDQTRSKDLRDAAQEISRLCDSILFDLGLPKSSKDVGEWRKALLALDLAMISYSGAHIERFDHRILGEDLDLAKITAAWTYITDGSEGVMFRRRSLRCLDKFLGGHQVWVLQPQSLWKDNSELYLSTNIEELHDIWGPIWAIKPSEESEEILRYNTGMGDIYAWPTDASTPSLEKDETFCHWIALDESQKEMKAKLVFRSRLLIGASTVVEQKTSQLKENDMCRSRTQHVLHQLRSDNAVEELGTRSSSMYLAEQQVCASVGAYGVQIGGTKVYKRRHGVSLKEAISTAWRNGTGDRNPALLEHFLGVEISFCTAHARRRRLKNVFAGRTVQHYLDSCRHGEPMPCEKAFDEAIHSTDPRAFRKLYAEHREWRKDLGQLVSWCLDGLSHSGYSEEDGIFRTLWMPRKDERAVRVKFSKSPHSWTGLLADTESHAAFGVVTGRCLISDWKEARDCQGVQEEEAESKKRSTVLETAVVVNERKDAPRPKGLELRAVDSSEKNPHSRWSISRIRRNERFALPHGRLKVIEPFARNTRLLVEWESGIARKLFDAKVQMTRTIGREVNLFHRELLDEEDWVWGTKPVPVFVVGN
ncbi:hypothetical protein K402DRAFT_391471 [Aulographum hederae CBS 113979]|uniref:Uncharacterized protein n=1 Tax=Aulographum hederae CBS 113979 TaxID=1176131 RepID=A0A6G1H6Z1_9PEZI|nr:hypothetical protein K402DRAFT_391471 [Aulographum hederae CBS 113979]